MATRFLYGAAVQGIQSFIFQTNKLRELVGASELVEEICTVLFKETVGKSFHEYDNESQTGAILNASGHIKYIFDEDDSSFKDNVIKNMPKRVQENAPGITFSQAVVKMSGDYEQYDKAVEELELLLKIQRNKPMRSQTLGMMGIIRSQETGLPAVLKLPQKWNNNKYDYFDKLTVKKLFADEQGKEPKKNYRICQKAFPETVDYTKVISNLDDKGGNNDWIAVIHIDGNGLGEVVETISQMNDIASYKDFSQKLTDAVQKSAQDAYISIRDKVDFNGKPLYFNENELIPIRPLILSGEDYNLICRADFAVEYVKVFLESFNEKTKFIANYPVCGKSNLTACAGIAFVKSSFPFYYAYNLANELCKFAKIASERKASCIMFHKVQDSFTESYEEIVERELTPQKNMSFRYGPYYLEHNDYFKTINGLLKNAEQLETEEGNAVKSHLHKWMSMLYDNKGMAEQELERLKSITSSTLRQFVENITAKSPYPVYDILTVNTINNQVTKEG